ncbi:BtpA/SgcQ family protein [Defluviimonas sp. SAOS-178_SWC]|uniref:BtpA/SgcQ family protein n=1 Tax=Defluviimonas sp. SAOS-178_SWC TaxID=3121287 RepID=UPI0032222328
MNRIEFHKLFKSPGPVILPVVHVLDEAQVTRNVSLAIQVGAPGILLINHDISAEAFVPLIRSVRSQFPTLWLGVNFLAVTGKDAFPVLGELQRTGTKVDAYWADDARIDEMKPTTEQDEAREIANVSSASGWTGLYFGGTCFKKQRDVAPEHYATSARIARDWMDVVTTSGIATGHAPELSKIEIFRNAIGDAPLALASGITCENARAFARFADCFIVGTGVNQTGDFHNFDQRKLADLMEVSRDLSADVSIC